MTYSSRLALPSGQVALLICISGFIPVLSAQNDFRPINVPLEIWLPHRYPHEPPLFFVRLNLIPPQNPPIIIRTTSISDARGIITFPGTFNTLVDAIKELQNEFSAELPIVSAPPSYNVAPTAGSQTQQPQQNFGATNNVVTSHHTNAPHSNSTGHHNNHNPTPNPTKRPEDIKAEFMAKINKKLSENAYKSSSQQNPAHETNYLLLQNRKDREREKLALSNEINLINKELEVLSQRQQNLEEWILQADNMDSIDKILIAQDPRSAQLADLLALESALNDAVFGVMKKILSAEPGLAIASGLRVIRDLSRRHFLTKFHIKKIVKK